MAEIDETLATYNRHPSEFAAYFRGIGPRVKYIEQALNFAGKSDGSADVLEIGCGDGRDAVEIVKRTKTYKGIDYSVGLIGLAKETLPDIDFKVCDMRTFTYPEESYDVVFSFASLLHMPKEDVRALIQKIALSLRKGGVFFVSLKYAPEYKKLWKEDAQGMRQFYLYNPELITALSVGYLKVVDTSRSMVGQTQWFEMVLQK